MRTRLARFMRALGHVVRSPIAALRAAGRAIGRWMADPDLDFVGVGVISTYAGRTFLFMAFAVGFASVGMWWHSMSWLAIVALDTIISIEVLGALRRLMRYDAMTSVLESMMVPAT